MKRITGILLVIVLLVTVCMTLVACGGDQKTIEGYFYRVDEDAHSVEVIKVDGNRFTVYTIKNQDVSATELAEIVRSDVENAITGEGVTSISGSCSYVDNSFIESRLDLKYDDNAKTSEYAYIKGDNFSYSPKMGMICFYALLGFCITLVVLCVLMGIIKLLGFSVEKATEKAKGKKKPVVENVADENVDNGVVYAKGTAGDLRLENVSERDAAMIMAIVADQTGEPLNTLRFISIKDITDQTDNEQGDN